MLKKLLIGIGLGLLALTATADIGYIDGSVANEGNGTSWATAFKTFSNCIAKIKGCYSTTTVYVAGGTYSVTNADIRTNSFYGGYPVGGGARDLANNPTIIDAANNARALLKTGASVSVLDGFTVMRAFAGSGTNGGGLYCTAGSLAIYNCTFTNCNSGGSGGAIFQNVASTNVFSNCLFAVNSSTNSNGGAIFLNGIESNWFYNCTFITNGSMKANHCGGAIFENTAAGNLYIQDCTFSNNFCDGNQNGGGAIYCQDTLLSIIGTNNWFINNTATNSHGGAVFHNRQGATNVFSNCWFQANSSSPLGSYHGGAIAFWSSCTNYFYGCTFYTNTAPYNTGAGGGIFDNAAGGLMSLNNCVFSNNVCGGNQNGGGAVYCVDYLFYATNTVFIGNSSTNSHGGAIFFSGGDVGIFSNCLFQGNSVCTNSGSGSYDGGGIATWGISTNYFYGCTFYTNTSGTGSGGVIFENGAGGLLSLISCTFSNNWCKSSGGALYLQDASIYATNCTFLQNNSTNGNGGALYNNVGSTNTVISNCTFIANSAGGAGNGGAIYIGNLSTNTFLDCNFYSNNTANSGGGIYLSAICSNIFSNCIFTANYCTNTGNGGAVYLSGGQSWFYGIPFFTNYSYAGNGGAIYDGAAGGNIYIPNCTFSNNWCKSSGGALYLQDASIYATNCTFLQNNSTNGIGGALYNNRAGATNNFIDCTFTSNNAGKAGNSHGGAVNLGGGQTSTWYNCLFFTNMTLNGNGGAIYEGSTGCNDWFYNCTFTNNKASTSAGGIFLEDKSLIMTNCLFINNSCTNGVGGAVYNQVGSTNTVISNCTFIANSVGGAGNGGAIWWNVISTNWYYNCLFYTNCALYSGGNGGAIFENANGFRDTIFNCTFSNNFAGGLAGALYVGGKYLFITNTLFINNSSTNSSGGAIYNGDGGTNTFSNVTFIANSAFIDGGVVHFVGISTNNFDSCSFVTNKGGGTGGGAIYEQAVGGSLQLYNCGFTNNSACNYGACKFLDYSLTITNCNFVGNTATNGHAGAAYVYYGTNNTWSNLFFYGNKCSFNGHYGGAIYIEGLCSNYFYNCSFITNTSMDGIDSRGGAIYEGSSGGKMFLTNCVFSNNVSSGVGGAISYLDYIFDAYNCDFIGNSATNHGGGVAYHTLAGSRSTWRNCLFGKNYCYPNGTTAGGGAIFLDNTVTTDTFINCTFYTNWSTNATVANGKGGAIYHRGVAAAVMNITNCIFWGNWASGPGTNISLTGSTQACNIAYSCMVTNLTAGSITAGTTNFGSGILTNYPIFCQDSAYPYDLHLQSQYGCYSNYNWISNITNSPCIDSGNPSDSYLNELWNGGRINMGRYGNTVEASKSKPPSQNVPNIFNDNKVGNNKLEW